MGVILLQEGKITDKGVLPPEACMKPSDFIELLPRVMVLDKKKEGGDSFGGIIVQSVDENGKITTLDF